MGVSEDAAIGRISKRLDLMENRLAGVTAKQPVSSMDVASLAVRLEALEASRRPPLAGAVGSSALAGLTEASREGIERPTLAASEALRIANKAKADIADQGVLKESLEGLVNAVQRTLASQRTHDRLHGKNVQQCLVDSTWPGSPATPSVGPVRSAVTVPPTGVTPPPLDSSVGTLCARAYSTQR